MTQRLTPAQWKAEVEKMVGWGAPLPEDQREPLIDHLAVEYPAGSPGPKPERRALWELETSPQADTPPRSLLGEVDRGGRLYATNCANCHGADGQGNELGPNLVEKPVLLGGREYEQVVRVGRGRMPGFAPLLDARGEAAILAWLRGRRYQPASQGSK